MKFCPECGTQINKQQTKNASRFECSANNCSYVHWNNPIPVVAALVKHNGMYLIARNAQWPKRIYSLITGYLEPGEEAESAVLREVKEELNLNGKITNYLGHCTFFERNQLIMAYEVEATGELKTNHELANTKYLTNEELSTYNFHPLYITEKIIRQWSQLNDKNI